MVQNVKCSYLRIEATKKFETFKINWSHWDLSLCKFPGRNSKVDFSGVPEGDHGVVSQDAVKNQISQQEFKWASLGIHWK